VLCAVVGCCRGAIWLEPATPPPAIFEYYSSRYFLQYCLLDRMKSEARRVKVKVKIEDHDDTFGRPHYSLSSLSQSVSLPIIAVASASSSCN
jgi:hypothetical protein